jgi:hypothetical protein
MSAKAFAFGRDFFTLRWRFFCHEMRTRDKKRTRVFWRMRIHPQFIGKPGIVWTDCRVKHGAPRSNNMEVTRTQAMAAACRQEKSDGELKKKNISYFSLLSLTFLRFVFWQNCTALSMPLPGEPGLVRCMHGCKYREGSLVNVSA